MIPLAIKIGITGPVGSIKSEALQKIIDMLKNDNLNVQGVLVSKVTNNGKLTGYTIEDIESKRKAQFCFDNFVSRVKIDKLGVDTKILEEILIPSLQKARETADVIVIDEIGKLENTTKKVHAEIEETLKCGKPLIVTLHKRSRNPVLQEIKSLEGVRVFDITPINKNILPFKVMHVLKGEE
ncbi:conserved hypothetical protein [Thermoplasma acidophilum]|uniref:Nucleoside-triphosphatase THEP1 n=1 Tax=Thermoplasma acidophilum (strain ATCC 25905 / DSM 1728 / JCM 9062 / NBRC 15155 / AMRC-C165) TaxID=273075 RepID=NTPTH_THEAC|nr:NTPase [Thermoplasma acidophilum]Q9HJH0.1 RecName: Full=Nucleoside-triphosphatase THEP1; Short=NTPase THEP1; AltName: Full=Nucleoside triphosphate phosphohydrolase [Thermoplasma acidophilum DSM 1728]CAC12127.1 conserved hypothetical protein [Thermoplasma acidophilum]